MKDNSYYGSTNICDNNIEQLFTFQTFPFWETLPIEINQNNILTN